MNYTKKEIGQELISELNKGSQIGEISNWAYDLYILSPDNISPEIDDILRHIFMMDAGPEFEYTEQELRLISEMLIKEEKDPFKKINDIKSTKLD